MGLQGGPVYRAQLHGATPSFYCARHSLAASAGVSLRTLASYLSGFEVELVGEISTTVPAKSYRAPLMVVKFNAPVVAATTEGTITNAFKSVV